MRPRAEKKYNMNLKHVVTTESKNDVKAVLVLSQDHRSSLEKLLPATDWSI